VGAMTTVRPQIWRACRCSGGVRRNRWGAAVDRASPKRRVRPRPMMTIFFFVSSCPAEMPIKATDGRGHADIRCNDHQITGDGGLGLFPEFIPAGRVFAGRGAIWEHRAERAFEEEMAVHQVQGDQEQGGGLFVEFDGRPNRT